VATSYPFNLLDYLSLELLEDVLELNRLLSQYGAKCYIVGGAIRDALLGRKSSDIDIEVYNITPLKFETIMREIKANGVGKSFFVYKYKTLDISLPRVEKKIAKGHRGFSVSLANDKKIASKRRDFTINALFYDIEAKQILDYWGGLRDIKLKRLRLIDEDSFKEDSLRVLRAMRFSAQLGFKIEEHTARVCRQIELDDLPSARIFQEFEKLFISPKPHFGLYALEELNISLKLWQSALERDTLFKVALRVAKAKLNRYCFLAIYKDYSKTPIAKILDAIGAPKIYYKELESLPSLRELNIDDILNLAIKRAIKDTPLSCSKEIEALAKRLGVWDKPIELDITPKELMKKGFRGKELGDELKREYLKRIQELKETLRG